MSEALAGKQYVVGFLFDQHGQRVLLIRKMRPQWQRGRINGIGGMVEDGEAPEAAMAREFYEETNLAIDTSQWRHFVTLSDARDWRIHFFFAHHDNLGGAEQTTDEEPLVFEVDDLPPDVIPNLRWLIPMALTMHCERAESFQVVERVGLPQ